MGAWIETLTTKFRSVRLSVAPYVGAWIETIIVPAGRFDLKSHPTWVRGLKLFCFIFHNIKDVAPYVGAWIETAHGICFTTKFLSHPTWVRGLKLRRS